MRLLIKRSRKAFVQAASIAARPNNLVGPDGQPTYITPPTYAPDTLVNNEAGLQDIVAKP